MLKIVMVLIFSILLGNNFMNYVVVNVKNFNNGIDFNKLIIGKII